MSVQDEINEFNAKRNSQTNVNVNSAMGNLANALQMLADETADEKLVKIYNTVADMQADSANITEGMTIQLLGYYTKNDGAGHTRKIESTDDGSGIQVGSFWANIVHNRLVFSKWFGVYGNGIADDSDLIQKAIDYNVPLKIETGVFNITKSLLFGSQNINGSGNFPSGTKGTIIQPTGNFNALKFKGGGYPSGGEITDLWINFGETKPSSTDTSKIGINLKGNTTGWLTNNLLKNITIRGAYKGISDRTGTYLEKWENITCIHCWQGFEKVSGTTLHLDTCYALQCYGAFYMSNFHTCTFTNCAFDQCNTSQFPNFIPIHIESIRGCTINGLQFESNIISTTERSLFYIVDSVVDISSAVSWSNIINFASGEAYIFKINSSRVKFTSCEVRDNTSGGAISMNVLVQNSSFVNLENCKFGIITGASLTYDIVSQGSKVNHVNCNFTNALVDTFNNGKSDSSAVYTLTSQIIEANSVVSLNQKSLNGLKSTDSLIYETNFDTQQVIIQPTYDGNNLVKCYLINPTSNQKTLSGILRIRFLD